MQRQPVAKDDVMSSDSCVSRSQCAPAGGVCRLAAHSLASRIATAAICALAPGRATDKGLVQIYHADGSRGLLRCPAILRSCEQQWTR